MLQEVKLKRELFTVEELQKIESLILNGQFEYIMTVIENIDPEKEIELQRVIDLMKPIAGNFESEVQKEMAEKLPNGPQTPEEEAFWDRKLQSEFKDHVQKIKDNQVSNQNKPIDKEAELEKIRTKLEKKLLAAQELEKKTERTEKQEEKLTKLKADILDLQAQEKELE